MHALLRYLPALSLVACSVACGDKGDDPAPDTSSSAGGSESSGGSGGTSTTTTSSNGGSGGSSTSGGGDASAAGGPGEPEVAYDMDDGLDGWIPQYTSSEEPDALIDVADLEISWNEEGGNPGGALQADIPYSEPSQWVGYGVSLSTPLDLEGRFIFADIMILAGVGEPEDLMNAPAGAKIYAKSGDTYVYAAGQYNNIDTIGEWRSIQFDLAFPDYVDEANGVFDPSDIREIGIQFDTNGETTTAQPGTWLVDNIGY